MRNNFSSHNNFSNNQIRNNPGNNNQNVQPRLGQNVVQNGGQNFIQNLAPMGSSKFSSGTGISSFVNGGSIPANLLSKYESLYPKLPLQSKINLTQRPSRLQNDLDSRQTYCLSMMASFPPCSNPMECSDHESAFQKCLEGSF